MTDSLAATAVVAGELAMGRLDFWDTEWAIIAPLLPTDVRGVPRAKDRMVLSGIFWRLRTGAPWADISERYGSHKTCYNRFFRLRVPQ